MKELEPDQSFAIEATSSLAESRTRVLKQGETFAIFDRAGDIRATRDYQGLFHEGTRYLSHLELRLGHEHPLLLTSTVKKDNLLLAIDLTNPPSHHAGEVEIPQGTLHLFRSKFLWAGVCYERIRITNYNLFPLKFALSLHFDADFADIFEVRGERRPRRGRRLETAVSDAAVVLGYEGLDKVIRRTKIELSPGPRRVTPNDALYEETLSPKGEMSISVTTSFATGDKVARTLTYDEAYGEMRESLRKYRLRACDITTSNLEFNNWLDRSTADLEMMITETATGPYPYAGVPWYSTVFGRDGLLTALEYLWLDPEIAKGVLSHLASRQATEVVAEQDAEPGKILHETRDGEMAALGEVPFRCYYGSVDSTPLFVLLANAYYQHTGDVAFIERLWPNIERALLWIDVHGDLDQDGFVEYLRHAEKGLANQGWKDSHDSVFHEDGTLAHGAIALCEVQAYVYAAKRGAAEMARDLGHKELAETLAKQAKALQSKFEKAFWDEGLGSYVLALDGEKRPLRVRTSNAGHVLFTGIARPDRAARLAATLLSKDFFSGWGLRTVASSESRYNPMAYHNGSIWPHDNALIAAGLARYGFKKEAVQITTGLFETTRFMDLNRLPELFCGFIRREDEAPTLYPVACSPQAWASGAVFMLLQACLGLSVRARPTPTITFHHPTLPDYLYELTLKNLRVGEASLDISIRRYREDVGIHVLRRDGEADIVIKK